ncbi:RNA polymerase subunit sigma-54 [Aerococcaceae bacterium zg-ZJ1578]|uniref:RNA polymerase factor sigma-54 n=1 Tax=Aerococcaceae bacterium zg-252 TaxID=2796928 RepID=UPI001A334FB5|nr:RNA polymerase subunit sigma-54 [Aerococcaceae bacterium zg-1578]
MNEKNVSKWQAVNLSQVAENKESLTHSLSDEQLVEILDLNTEQLTYYLEESILENPFIEMEYPIEKKVANIDSAKINHVDESVNYAIGTSQSLIMFLFEQIMLFRQTPIRDAMVRLVDYLDERGYLPYTYQELAEKLSLDAMITLDAMTLLKQLEPAGVGAYDLQECLMLQTEQDSKAPNIAYYLLEEYFDLLTAHNIEAIEEKSQFNRDEIEECLSYFHTLRPVPAALFERQQNVNLIPDVSVRYRDEWLEMRYNRHFYPQLIFNQGYFDEMAQQNDAELQAYIEKHRLNYQLLDSCLNYREKLIMAMIQAIVKAQVNFFKGETDEKVPYLLKDLAKDLNISESIAKLLVTNKNIEVGTHVYPLTDFITVTHHKGRGGLNMVNIKEIIAQLIDNASSTISNADLVEQLEEQKIIMSEQLVEDYRRALGK